jgi:hypothetical protein
VTTHPGQKTETDRLLPTKQSPPLTRNRATCRRRHESPPADGGRRHAGRAPRTPESTNPLLPMSIQASAAVEGPCTGQTEELRRAAMVEELRWLAKVQRTCSRSFWGGAWTLRGPAPRRPPQVPPQVQGQPGWWRGSHDGWFAGVVEQPRGHDTRARVAC